jgi:hypothetical protein
MQPITARNCGACGHTLVETWYDKFLNQVARHAFLIKMVFVAFVLACFLPAPFSPLYLFKRVFWTPSALCEDGIYSFASTRAGACSSHGGVKTWR